MFKKIFIGHLWSECLVFKCLTEHTRLRIKIAFLGFGVCLFSFFTEELINRDGILYLQAAQVYIENGFSASLKQYGWSFYPILIALFHSVTTLSLENSAHLLNVILVLVLVDAFSQFYWEINLKTRYHWMPALVLLAYTGLNDYRPMIIRDWGYWAFLFQALLYFVRAYKTDNSRFQFLWQFFIVLAFLFRIEAVVFFVLLPLWSFYKKRSIVSFLKSTYLFLLPVVVVFFYSGWNEWGRIQDIYAYIDVVFLVNQFIEYSSTVAHYAIPIYADQFAILFAISGLLGVLSFNFIAKLGVIYLCIILVGLFRYKLPKTFQFSLVILLIVASFFIIFIFFCNSRVLAGRYLIQISLFCLIYVTYFSEKILDELRASESSYLIAMFGGLFLINFVVGLYHSESNKLHIKKMGQWFSINIPDSSYVTTNDSRLYYYGGGIFKKHMSNGFSLKSNEYALLRVKQNETRYAHLIDKGVLVEVYSIVGKKGDSAILFKINNP